jgi:hypothetical protein
MWGEGGWQEPAKACARKVLLAMCFELCVRHFGQACVVICKAVDLTELTSSPSDSEFLGFFSFICFGGMIYSKKVRV